MDASVWVNLGILVVTALVGLLSWLGARKSAREARVEQQEANAAAKRSAAAAARLVEIEEARQASAEMHRRRASLRAERTSKDSFRFNRPSKDDYITLSNSGESKASRLEILVNNRRIADYDFFHPKTTDDICIGPRGRFDIMVLATKDFNFPFDLIIRWDDESELRGEWHGTVG